MCEFHDSNCNGLGDMWWTDRFSIIDEVRQSVQLTPVRGKL